MDNVEMSESNTLDDIRGSHNYIYHNPKPQYSGGSSFPYPHSFPSKFHMHLFNYLAMRRFPEPKPAQIRDLSDNKVTWAASITIDAVFPPRNVLERRTFTQIGRTKQAAKDAAARDALIALGVNLLSLQD
ncbi:hypothetical protein FRC02_004140 [Tulasnella sp. 418]|nr:hypothetical protein FRC02_004140 [Tulasnella sp. 418]